MASLLVQPPLGGIQRQTGYQNRPPYSAYDLMNFWPVDPITGRAILASRPPLTVLTAPVGPTTLLKNVNGVAVSKPKLSFLGSFNGDLHWWNGTGFTAATGGITVPTTTAVYCGTLFHEVYIPRAGANDIAVFNYETGDTAAIVETAGTAPDDCFFITEWLGAIVAVTNDEPEIIQMSRIGNGKDWDFSAPIEDEFGAYSSTVTSPGGIGAPVNAFAAHSDDSALISTLAGTFILRGHPRRGGVFDKVLDTYMLGQGAWAKGQDDTLYFLTPEGIFTMPPGSGTIPAPLSKGKVPEELIGLDYEFTDPKVTMAYDARWNGIIIKVRGEQEQAWRYDINTGGFFREEYLGYPFVALEHKPFLTDQSSGVLFGGTQLRFHDKFGTEEFISSAIIGPVKISDSSIRKKKVVKVRVIFGGNTPTGDGSLAMATGADAEDAILKILRSEAQHSIPLSQLKDMKGTYFPITAGCALAMQLTASTGRVSLEGIDIDLMEGGVNNTPRSVPFDPTGDEIDFTDPGDDFDDENWVGYSEATPAVPICTLPDHTLFVDLSRLPAEWWAEVAADGADIRVTDNSNNEKARDVVLINFDKATMTGFLTLKITQQDPPTPVRIWSGNPFVSDYAPDATFGQFNAYDSNWLGFYPNGGADEDDRTVNQNNLTLTGLPADPTDAFVTGLIGVNATDYRTVDTTNNFGVASAEVPTAPPVTMVAVCQMAANQSTDVMGVFDASGGHEMRLQPQRSALGILSQVESDTDTTEVAATANVTADANFNHFVGVLTSISSRHSYYNAVTSTVNSDVQNAYVGLDELVVGKGSRSGLSSSSFLGNVTLVQYHNAVRSACWVDYQYRMLDQDDFWGDWGDFVEVNDPSEIQPPVPPPDDGVCPTGFLNPTEVGTWSGFASATPDAPALDLRGVLHFVDLSNMPTEWWTAVKADGSDIRVTDSANRFLPFDLIHFDSTADTGFLIVRSNQSSSLPRQFRIWVGNATAITLVPCTSYGQYATYGFAGEWEGFWPDGSGEDRTRHQRHLTSFGTTDPTVGTGPIGAQATSYDGVDQSASVAISPAVPYANTLMAVVRVDSLTENGYAMSVTAPDIGATFRNYNLRHNFAEFRASDAISEDTIDANQWRLEYGSAMGASYNVRRWAVYHDGDGYASPRVQSPGPTSIGRVGIGAFATSSGGAFMFPLDCEVSLAGLLNMSRFTPFDDIDSAEGQAAWANYYAAMLDQNAFYNLGGVDWVWTAESNDLDQ